jgi:D-aminoacyl-tRNA deacylase
VRVVLQRVKRAEVRVETRVTGSIGRGLVLLVGFTRGDSLPAVEWMADRVKGLRIFADEDGRMNRSLLDVGGSLLVVSQFTLYGDARKGRRPSFVDAAPPDIAVPLYEEFGAMMEVELVNDGPVTLILDR